MANLFFDTETTGMPLWKEPSSDPGQPGIVQLALLLEDDSGKEVAGLSFLVDSKKTIGAEAGKVHGITQADVKKYGIKLRAALAIFELFAGMADQIVAHSASFDLVMMKISFLAESMDSFVLKSLAEGKITEFCTMRKATPIVKLPGSRGYKWPKLEECIRYFFDEELVGAHDAMVDVRACRRVYHALKATPPF